MYTLTAKEAANRLTVSTQTIYAYVSRGKIRAKRDVGSRASMYHCGDVEKLREVKQLRNSPQVVQDALHWGTPLLDTSVSTIHDGQLYYRGVTVETLADSTFEETISLLWGAETVSCDPLEGELRAVTDAARRLPFLHAATAVTAALDAIDPRAKDPGDSAVMRCGLIALRACSDLVAHKRKKKTLAERLADAWGVERNILDTALILSADHEINVSTFTCRCIASANASPYAAVTGGLSAMKGSRHGGSFARIAALFDESKTATRLTEVLRERIDRGDSVTGFNHPLYPDGDVRTDILFARIDGPWIEAVKEAGIDLGLRPMIDLALCALARDLELPSQAPLILFVLGRIAGWISHYQEQITSQRLIRPRARYIGDIA